MGKLTQRADGQEKSNSVKRFCLCQQSRTGSLKSQRNMENVCKNYLSVSIKSRKRGQEAKIVMLALWGKYSVCTWVRVMVSAEKYPLSCTTATNSSKTDSECTVHSALNNCLRQCLDFFYPPNYPQSDECLTQSVVSSNLKPLVKSGIVLLKNKLRWKL